MSNYTSFNFDAWNFNESTKTLALHYSIDDSLYFTETYRFYFDFAPHNAQLLNRAIATLFYLAGVSYYKTFTPKTINDRLQGISKQDAAFYQTVYQQGLGEFFYVNKLSPKTEINFPATSKENRPIKATGTGMLVGLGGGKDSLVSVELVREQPKVATWSLGHRKQLEPLVQKIGLPHFWVERQWDTQLLDLNKQGAHNGHVPLSAILSAVGTIVAILTGYKDVVVSNESSASEPNLVYDGVAINHQYSKSLEYEQLYQKHLERHFGDSTRYYSLLRPFSELRIAELFAQDVFEKYKDVFSSCNRAFTHDSTGMFWCGECPKCAFVFLALTPFLPRKSVETLFGGKNLLLDPNIAPTYRQLLGIEGDKPLECVGEIKESRTAMRLAQAMYPELQSYDFDLPKDYDFRSFGEHALPNDILPLLNGAK
jgi:UDP-N-acetyl-alpha-D-muramoyl-L-alanyl-L-glutamate epimerase